MAASAIGRAPQDLSRRRDQLDGKPMTARGLKAPRRPGAPGRRGGPIKVAAARQFAGAKPAGGLSLESASELDEAHFTRF